MIIKWIWNLSINIVQFLIKIAIKLILLEKKIFKVYLNKYLNKLKLVFQQNQIILSKIWIKIKKFLTMK